MDNKQQQLKADGAKARRFGQPFDQLKPLAWQAGWKQEDERLAAVFQPLRW